MDLYSIADWENQLNSLDREINLRGGKSLYTTYSRIWCYAFMLQWNSFVLIFSLFRQRMIASLSTMLHLLDSGASMIELPSLVRQSASHWVMLRLSFSSMIDGVNIQHSMQQHHSLPSRYDGHGGLLKQLQCSFSLSLCRSSHTGRKLRRISVKLLNFIFSLWLTLFSVQSSSTPKQTAPLGKLHIKTKSTRP